jgi:hypothetical protein
VESLTDSARKESLLLHIRYIGPNCTDGITDLTEPWTVNNSPDDAPEKIKNAQSGPARGSPPTGPSLASFQVAGPFESHHVHEDTLPYRERAASESDLLLSTVSPHVLVLDKSKENEEAYTNANTGGASVIEQMLDEEIDAEPDLAAHSCSPPLPGNISGAGALPQFPSVSSCANLSIEVDGPSLLQGFPHSATTPPIDGFGPASSTEHPRSPRADPRGTKRPRSCDLKCVSSISH